MRSLLFFLLLVSGGGFLQGEVLNFALTFDPGDLEVIRQGDAVQLRFRGALPEIWPGKPEIPSLGIHAVIPRNSTVDHIEVVEVDEEPVLKQVFVRPSQFPRVPGYIEPEAVPPDPGIYSVSKRFPENVVEFVTCGNLSGYRLAGFKAYPVRYNPVERTVYLVKKVAFRVYLRPAEPPELFAYRKDERVFKKWKEAVASLVVNPEDLERYGPPTRPVRPRGGFGAGLMPSLDDNPYDLLIITTEEMENVFKEMAQWKTEQGIPATVRTVSWIENNYSGSDLAEKIRYFIRDAYRYWGIQWVLLGADSPEIPLRVVYVNVSSGPAINKYVPTDMYYACLDGNWNADLDTTFGEPLTDSADFYPEVLVSRIPVRNAEEAELFFEKLRKYVEDPDLSYLEKALFVGTEMQFYPGDGASLCDTILQHLPPYFQKNRMYEIEGYHSTEEFVDSLYSGQHIVFTESHGNVGWFFVNYEPREPFMNSMADSLHNDTRLSFFHLVACMIGAVDKDCIAEHLFRSPGGGIAVMATTRYNFPFSALYINESLYDSIFYANDPLGVPISYADISSRVLFLPALYNDAVKRYIYLTYNLLADPTMVIWNRAPISVVVETPDSLPLGFSSIKVKVKNAVTGQIMRNVLVTLYKEGEVFDRKMTDEMGTAIFDFQLQSPGYLFLTAHASDILLYRDSIPVYEVHPYLKLTKLEVLDTGGDDDGVPEAGEMIGLRPYVYNGSSGPAMGVWARVREFSSYLSLYSDSVYIGNVAPGDTAFPLLGFVTSVSDSVPDNIPALLSLTFMRTIYSETPDSDYVRIDTLGYDTVSIVLRAPKVEHHGHVLSSDADTFYLRVGLINRGGGDSRNLMGILTSNDNIHMLDSVVDYGTLSPNSVVDPYHAPPFTFVDEDPEEKQFMLILQDERGIADTITFVYLTLDTVWNITTTPLPSAIKVSWYPRAMDADVLGYRIYRSTNPNGSFRLLQEDPVAMAYFIDYNLTVGPTYYYMVTIVDTSWNESQPAGPVPGYPNPPDLSGWPQYIPDAGYASPLICDFDPSYPGNEIVLPATFYGSVYAYYADGNIMPGWPVDFPEGTSIYSTPAAGDIDGDGQIELIVAPMGTVNKVYAFEKDGSYVSGWPRPIAGGTGSGTAGILATPAVGDLDGDGSPEVVVHTLNGKIYVWRGDGTAFGSDTTGFFVHIPGESSWCISSPSLADIDNDGNLDIVIGSKSDIARLYVYNSDGTVKTGFPVDLDSRQIGASVAVADFLPSSPGLEMAVATTGNLYIVKSNGEIAEGWPVSFPYQGYNHYVNPSAADVDGDGEIEVLINAYGEIGVFDPDGETLPGFPVSVAGGGPSSVIVGDPDDDGHQSLFRGTDECLLYGFSDVGQLMPGFPINLIEEAMATPSLADLNGDGTVELIATGYADQIWVFELGGSYSPDNMEWPTYKHDPARTGCYSASVAGVESQPMESRRLAFEPPVPNPFRGSAILTYTLPEKSCVSIKIYDVSGKLVRVLHRGVEEAGVHRIRFDGSNDLGRKLPSGVYFFRLETDRKKITRRALLLR